MGENAWIWLDPGLYPEYQASRYNSFSPHAPVGAPALRYGVAEFRSTILTLDDMVEVELNVSADAAFRLWINDRWVGSGPASAGGDFLCIEAPPRQYASRFAIPASGRSLRILAQVQLSPLVGCAFSFGHGGFHLTGAVIHKDGSRDTFRSDPSWEARLNPAFQAPGRYDSRRKPEPWHAACRTEPIWRLADAPIPPLEECRIRPDGDRSMTVAAGMHAEYVFLFNRIHAGHVLLDVAGHTPGAMQVEAEVTCFELPEQDGTREWVAADGPLSFRSFALHSIGGYRIRVDNRGDVPVTVSPALMSVSYPVTDAGDCRTSDEGLNRVFDVCRWTLRICRQSLHLDSPRHQEPLACTGDYLIQTLMTAFTFGDMRLAAFDVQRTADWLVANDGVMFHTSYSLIWVQMLEAVFRFTGDRTLVASSVPALRILLERFHGYIGDNGLLEHAPNYMFVDWLVEEGYSLHHPPKALGQSCLNAFYHKALTTAAALYRVIGDDRSAERCTSRAEALGIAFRSFLYDASEGLFFDGLPTPSGSNEWLPENVPLRHFSRHANVLAVLCDFVPQEEGRTILEKVLTSETLQQVQPYFMHFVLEAVAKTGLFAQYGMPLLSLWQPIVDECGKGLKEGWFAPEEGYSFDHSHAWGGTPAYQLPCRLLGFRMLEPGFRRIALSPRLYGLAWADVSMPTPYGRIRCRMRAGMEPDIEVPEEIAWQRR